MSSTPAVCVVGWQDSGKTLLLTQMIAHWTKQGLRVASIKHDGHADMAHGLATEPGKSDYHPDWEKDSSDTVRHAQAGAVLTMIAGGGQTLLRDWQDNQDSQVELLVERLSLLASSRNRRLDMVLVEGFKQSHLPKVVMVRDAAEARQFLKPQIANVIAIVGPKGLAVELADSQWRVYDDDSVAALCQDLWHTLCRR